MLAGSSKVAGAGTDADRPRTLLMVVAVLAVIAVGVGIYSFAKRPKPQATGAILDAFAVALPGNNVLATVTVNFDNIAQSPLWVREIKARLTAADGQPYTDDAASPMDFDRYFQGYPDLRQHSVEPLKVETKVEPGNQMRGSVIVSFPVTLDSFNHRKSLVILIYPYTSNPYAEVVAGPGKEEVVEIK
jgi:hypothetical protein